MTVCTKVPLSVSSQTRQVDWCHEGTGPADLGLSSVSAPGHNGLPAGLVVSSQIKLAALPEEDFEHKLRIRQPICQELRRNNVPQG